MIMLLYAVPHVLIPLTLKIFARHSCDLVLVYWMICKLVIGLDMNLRITLEEFSKKEILYLKKKLAEACTEILKGC